MRAGWFPRLTCYKQDQNIRDILVDRYRSSQKHEGRISRIWQRLQLAISPHLLQNQHQLIMISSRLINTALAGTPTRYSFAVNGPYNCTISDVLAKG